MEVGAHGEMAHMEGGPLNLYAYAYVERKDRLTSVTCSFREPVVIDYEGISKLLDVRTVDRKEVFLAKFTGEQSAAFVRA